MSNIVVLIGIIGIVFTNDVKSCSCGLKSFEWHYQNTEVILIGKVVNIESAYSLEMFPEHIIDENNKAKFTGDSTLVRFAKKIIEIEVVRKIKNMHVLNKIEVITDFYDSACGYNFKVGKEYVLYAYNKSPKYFIYKAESNLPIGNLRGRHFTTNSCTGTTESVDRELKLIEDYWNKNSP